MKAGPCLWMKVNYRHHDNQHNDTEHANIEGRYAEYYSCISECHYAECRHAECHVAKLSARIYIYIYQIHFYLFPSVSNIGNRSIEIGVLKLIWL